MRPPTPSELAAFVAENAAGPRRAVFPAGGRTGLHYGYPASKPGVTVSTELWTSVVEYPARDMTVTVQSGAKLRDLAELLRQEGQQLPIDAPDPESATVGGILATNAGGPRRYGYGTLRDYVIGISAVDGTGRQFSAGGRVVKNVAGYDLCKLLVGSFGSLGIITQVTFKLRPIPAASAAVWSTFDRLSDVDAALARLLTSDARPVALEVLNGEAARRVASAHGGQLPVGGPVLAVGVEGAPADVEWQVQRLKDELRPFGPKATEFLDDRATSSLHALLTGLITESASLVFKANLLPSRTCEFIEHASRVGISVAARAGNGIVVGHLPREIGSAEAAEELLRPLRRLARSGNGNLVIVRCPDEWKSRLPVLGEAEPSWPLMLRVKAALDPHGVLNPGRFIDGTAASRG